MATDKATWQLLGSVAFYCNCNESSKYNYILFLSRLSQPIFNSVPYPPKGAKEIFFQQKFLMRTQTE